MKLDIIRKNIGSEIKLTKSGNRFIPGCRFYIHKADSMNVHIKIIGPVNNSYGYVNSRSIASVIVPVVEKKAPVIKVGDIVRIKKTRF